jgi:lipoprotein signal peptidase
MTRQATVLAVALPLAVADLVWKGVATTPAWAYHPRSPGWLLLCLLLVIGALVVVRVPSAVVPLAAGLLAGGVLGNALSAAWNGLRVPDPIIAVAGTSVIAFNLADVFTLIGIISLTSALAVALIRHRHLLPGHEAPPAR